ncbi:hypothetical protein AAFF_G00058850 [Aldrovandia affinis]|uniref:Uncharacterized protein n=1 Tax=Aldrovandia affinis TaxID=143900 RepID=A0AAD7S2P8_9TELE|nr:hypothetical protein AAFF_G00058850 [Aldrovandia affinis]
MIAAALVDVTNSCCVRVLVREGALREPGREARYERAVQNSGQVKGARVRQLRLASPECGVNLGRAGTQRWLSLLSSALPPSVTLQEKGLHRDGA